MCVIFLLLLITLSIEQYVERSILLLFGKTKYFKPKIPIQIQFYVVFLFQCLKDGEGGGKVLCPFSKSLYLEFTALLCRVLHHNLYLSILIAILYRFCVQTAVTLCCGTLQCTL